MRLLKKQDNVPGPKTHLLKTVFYSATIRIVKGGGFFLLSFYLFLGG